LSVSGSPLRWALGGLLACGLGASGPVSADVIADFNAIGARTMTTPPGAYPAVTPEEQRGSVGTDLATLHAAMYDAVVAIAGGYIKLCGGGHEIESLFAADYGCVRKCTQGGQVIRSSAVASATMVLAIWINAKIDWSALDGFAVL
jgi:hypothetical protein